MPKKADKNYQHINRFDWKKVLNWKYPYRDYGLYGALKDPKYIKHRDELFNINGNGWWWGNGWWSTTIKETPAAYHRRKRKERGL